MSELLSLFLNNIFPIITVAGVGFLLERLLKIDPKHLSAVIFNALIPALLFRLLLDSQFSGSDILKMIGLAGTVIILLCLLSYGISRVMKLTPVMTAAFILTVAFMNAGNYGLSLNSFALGQIGLAWASLFYVTSSSLNSSLGVFIANTGKVAIIDALKGLLRVPHIYAICIAITMRFTGIHLPGILEKPLDLLSSVAIPAMLLVLGMQISRTRAPANMKLVVIAACMRMLVSPLLAWALTFMTTLPPVATQAAILESAMPSPVLSIIISMEFDTDPEFVSAVVLLTTLISPLTVTPIMAMINI